MALSEKAKGKQRAVDPEQPSTPPSKDLTIRFTEGIPDLTIRVSEKDTVKDVKTNVSPELRPFAHPLRVLTAYLYCARLRLFLYRRSALPGQNSGRDASG